MRFRGLAFGATAAALILALGSTTAVAQDGTGSPDDVYALSYFSNAHTALAPDAALRLVNDGFVSDASPAGDLCASIYVFDSNEQLAECCSCKVTPNGILSLSVNTNLTNNTLTQITPKRGVIKVVSSYPNGTTCDPTYDAPVFGIKGWISHVQKGTGTAFGQTEEELSDASFGPSEETDLVEDCLAITELGAGGRGKCSCTDSLQ